LSTYRMAPPVPRTRGNRVRIDNSGNEAIRFQFSIKIHNAKNIVRRNTLTGDTVVFDPSRDSEPGK
jgi:hypothetical protein